MKSLLRKRPGGYFSEDGVNPMDGLGNLADIMLIFAVGIMLALVMNWNVDIGSLAYAGGEDVPETETALEFESEDLEQQDSAEIDGGGMRRLGSVFYDEASGKYYIVSE